MPASATQRAIDAVWRIESARLIGGLTRITRDVAVAEDLAQDAFVAALEQWPAGSVRQRARTRIAARPCGGLRAPGRTNGSLSAPSLSQIVLSGAHPRPSGATYRQGSGRVPPSRRFATFVSTRGE